MVALLPTNVLGQEVTKSLFGGNHLLTTNTNLGRFSMALDATGVTALRYPGGSVTEKHFDVRNPDRPVTDNRDAESAPLPSDSFVNLTDFLTFAIARSEAVTIVLPTRNLLTGPRSLLDDPRLIDLQKVAEIKQFVKALLSEGGSWPDAEIAAFELGNEYWFEGEMTAREYGRVVNVLSVAVQEAIDEARSQQVSQPKILVQMGEPFDQQYTRGGIYGNLSWLEKVAQANLQIITEIQDERAKSAIDGLIEHFYYIQEDDTLIYSRDSTRFIGLDYSHWEQRGYQGRDLAITEWNVERDNAEQLGLKGASVIVHQLESMVKLGVDSAFAWPIQQNGPNDLAGGANAVVRLSPLGAAFKMMSESLPGTVLIETNQISSTVTTSAYGSQDRFVLFVMSRSAGNQSISMDISSLVPSNYILQGTKLGIDLSSIDGKHWDRKTSQTVAVLDPWSEHDAKAELTQVAATELGTVANITFDLGAYEVMRLEFLAPANEAPSSDGNGDRTLKGSSGDDRFRPGVGAINIDGGLGIDTIDYSFALASVHLNMITGVNSGFATGHRYLSIENVVGSSFNDTIVAAIAGGQHYGGAGDDLITGSTRNNWLSGDKGNDTLLGGSGDDILIGGAGDDLLWGGGGRDELFGGEGRDVAAYIATDGRGIVANLFSPNLNTGIAANAVYTSVEGLRGTVLADVLIGNSAANILQGDNGNDKLFGNDGNDSIFGGQGADLIDGGNGFDIVFFTGPTAVVFDLISPLNNKGEAVGDSYRSIESFSGTVLGDGFYGNGLGNQFLGEGGNDVVAGRGGNDTLIGGAGDDLINGGSGVDQLYGGSGADRFLFGSDGGVDVLFDFSLLDGDRILLESSIFTGPLSNLDVVQRFGSMVGGNATLIFDADDRISFVGVTTLDGLWEAIQII